MRPEKAEDEVEDDEMDADEALCPEWKDLAIGVVDLIG